jgi:D-alanyl-D-alanine carboxypeptidase/D-alanyl-D-alanine-endopeptidase (penicillin-binding protein 4)
MLVIRRTSRARTAAISTVVSAAVAVPLSLVAASPAQAATPPEGANVSETRIWKMLNSRDGDSRLRWTYSGRVMDATDGQYIYSKNATVSMKSASTMKAVTSAIALRLYGKSHTFPTVARQGSRSLEVVLVAGGDPLLTRSSLRYLAGLTAKKLAAALPESYRYQTITYSVRADDSLFGDATRGPAWGGTTYNRTRAFLLDRQRTDDSTRDAGRSFAVSLDYALDSALRSRGIRAKVVYDGRKKAPEGAAMLGYYGGHTLGESIRTALMWSDTNMTEMLHRHIAIAMREPATRAGGIKAENAVLADLGIDMSNVSFADGSGLSAYNRVTAKMLVEVMQAAQRPTEKRMNALRGLLMVAGRTGTLSTRFGRFDTSASRCAIGYAWAKSGTIGGVITLTGYAKAKDGRLKAFAFLVNNTAASASSTRDALDGLVATVVGCR